MKPVILKNHLLSVINLIIKYMQINYIIKYIYFNAKLILFICCISLFALKYNDVSF